jgi:cytidylate kinase
MQIICVCRCSYWFGKELAEKLATNLGYQCVAREELTDKAALNGIPIGKIETAIMKRKPISEDMAIYIDCYKALVTREICEHAVKGGIVYHGRACQGVLPGLSHVLTIRTIADMEQRINRVCQRMKLSRKQAKKYIDEVDEDRRRWVKFLYNFQWDDSSYYDVIVNSAHLSVDNTARALVSLAQLPEFQPTPANIQKIQDLLLQSKCRLAIGEDDRTRFTKVTVAAEKGNVSVTYLPRFGKQAEYIPAILEKIDGIKSLICTVATTNILFVQERFSYKTETFNHLIEIAEKWNASIDLVRLVDLPVEEGVETSDLSVDSQEVPAQVDGGILEDTPDSELSTSDSYGIPETIDRLVQVGRAGTVHTIFGNKKNLVNSFKSAREYSLIAIGDVFLSSGSEARKRLKRELIAFLSDHIRVPVIRIEDLKEQYLFGPKQWGMTFIYALLCILLFWGIFSYQDAIIKFLTQPGMENRILAAVLVALFSFLAARIISGFTHNILKFLKIE